MKLLSKTSDYDETIKLANKLTGEYDKSVIFHCYWNGNLNQKHLYSVLSCYYFNVLKHKHKIILWLENNTPNDINKEISKTLSLKKEIENYELAEIEIEFDNEINKLNKIKVITDKIEEIGFENTALNYSIAPSAPDKGKIGWISSNSLSKNILKEIQTLKLGEVSEPIQVSNGYLFLQVNDKKEIKEKFDLKKELEQQINFEKNRQLNQFSLNYYKKLKKNVIIDEDK